ncbi:MAG: hypothetical protein Q4C96_11235 [Planctomycetia bacterium]|nr:hypothetical protein [Planctomycetia bacterium]
MPSGTVQLKIKCRTAEKRGRFGNAWQDFWKWKIFTLFRNDDAGNGGAQQERTSQKRTFGMEKFLHFSEMGGTAERHGGIFREWRIFRTFSGTADSVLRSRLLRCGFLEVEKFPHFSGTAGREG